MAGVNSKMDHELIGDNDIFEVEAYASCRWCNIIPHSGLLSDNNYAVHVTASSDT